MLAFDERLRGGLWLFPTAAGTALLATAVVMLARSPLLQGETAVGEQSERSSTGSRSA